MRPPEVKICGLTRAEDAAAAEAAGAVYGGVILAEGSPRTLTATTARAVFGESGLVRCGVFVDAPVGVVMDAVGVVGLAVLQLHGDETPEYVERVAAETGRPVWKAVRPRTGDEFAAAVERYAGVVDALLLDGWSAKARGGTGARFPWEEVAARRALLPGRVRLVVAGGLGPDNVARVISVLAPDVVDVSSGVEISPGIKDPQRIEAFARAVAGTG